MSVVCLLGIGVVMLFSTSAFAEDSHGDVYYFVKRQLLWLCIGGLVCAVIASTDYSWITRLWWLWFGIAVVLLTLCYIPPIGMKINGSRRWINLGFMAFQPSEIAKLSTIIFLAWWYAKFERRSKSLFVGFVVPSTIVGLLLGLILFEEDLGATALIGAAMLAVMFAAGANLFLMGTILAAGVAGLAVLATQIEERLGRIMAFQDPEKYKLGDGLQQWQALLAFGSGGVDGLGLGEGRQKMLYLPYAHTDFILPMIGEELGLRFTLLTVMCYLILACAGCLIAVNARERSGMLLAFGVTILLALQAAVNIGVTTSLLPNKGMPLPFISYGGSNLLICLFLVGLLISVHRHGRSQIIATTRFGFGLRRTSGY